MTAWLWQWRRCFCSECHNYNPSDNVTFQKICSFTQRIVNAVWWLHTYGAFGLEMCYLYLGFRFFCSIWLDRQREISLNSLARNKFKYLFRISWRISNVWRVKSKRIVRFQVLMVLLKIQVFWAMTSCHWVSGFRHSPWPAGCLTVKELSSF
jgi:hypothetical protein